MERPQNWTSVVQELATSRRTSGWVSGDPWITSIITWRRKGVRERLSFNSLGDVINETNCGQRVHILRPVL